MPVIADNTAGQEPLVPRRAPVVPRVRLEAGGAALPLEHHVRAIYKSALFSRIKLAGPAGSGKSTALQHLAAALPPTLGVDLGNDRIGIGGRLSVFISSQPTRSDDCITLEMAPWNQDDLVEYCAAVHRDRCASILRRALAPQQSAATLSGLPELWRAVLDALAGDETLEDVNSALSRVLEKTIPDPAQCAIAGDLCLEGVQKNFPVSDATVEAARQLSEAGRRALRHHQLRSLLAANRLAGLLTERQGFEALRLQYPRNLIEQTAVRIRGNETAMEHLREMMEGKNKERHSTTVSLLHAAGDKWRPSGRRWPNLRRAHLAAVQWAGVNLRDADIRAADLCGADLSCADLTKISADAVRLSDAALYNAHLTLGHFDNADLSRCDLQSIDAADCFFRGAQLTGARLQNANLQGAQFQGADLREARLTGANLSRATLLGTQIDEADFTGVNFTRAAVQRMRLNVACFDGAIFAEVRFNACDFSGMHLSKADFHGAFMGKSDLTATIMPNSNWQEADLRGCGLAEVEWEGANLRSADFSNASFHMGSTRSGLVGSVIASEGTRTGFYTDDYLDQDYKPPEEIRKANLCGCNLRGAKVEKTDWYLVDLRGANYTRKQAEHFARCGAILRDRT